MGQVWEAQDESLSRRVAVKVISLLAGDGRQKAEARARFLREAQITAGLQHPNIVTVYDLGETGTGEDRVPFLVMELVRGEGLDALLRRGAVTRPDAARWGAQICDALSEAHAAGVMHRDIKPSNILISPSGTVKVLDFGVARAVGPQATAARLTQTGFIVGTPAYMAPEQARGHPEPSSDLYALGCLLFELMTGRLPFSAPDTAGCLAAHLTQDPPAPSSLAPGVPPAWDDIVLTLLRKEPGERYSDAAGLAQALRGLDHTYVSTVPEPRNPRPAHADGPFAISWTGKEPLSAYATSRERRWIVGLGVPGAVSLAGLLVSLAMSPDALSQDDASGWALGAQVLLVVVSLVLLPLLWLLIYFPLSHDRSAWSVQVGPLGIRTTNGLDRREYKWSEIKTLAIEEVVGNKVRCAAGLHVKFRKGAEPSAHRPAGWPYRFGDQARVRNGRVPICVFGPMTDRQWALLTETLARYGQGRWEDEAWPCRAGPMT
ncbi:hypothetical protein SPAR_42379 [Streptomyces sparsogenes DSM 40356]|uniref:non-specific serine/threonine protein kinase n=2 Tax=Streptomyces sparsogenes TaxID=67365 RepID=A0A1R1S518_9ACTN|nr:serine/threonine-protein kinase [Streptomyces sparsogenes]OMI33259.1 hypothetical protein SPAR_42379 [Streptomyces sparsogenes DSM 40356]